MIRSQASDASLRCLQAAQVEAVPMDMLEEQLAHGTSMQVNGARAPLSYPFSSCLFREPCAGATCHQRNGRFTR